LWRFEKHGTYARQSPPYEVQRYRCVTCRRTFGDQTFRVTYWLRRADLLRPVFYGLLSCSGFRQIARQFDASPQTIAGLSARLGRHCLLFHEARRPRGPIREPLSLDSFESFEYSQFFPTSYHLVAGRESHFTDSELRRKGRMTDAQKRTRLGLEARLGRPRPRAIEEDVAALLAIVAPTAQEIVLHTDEHKSYPRALRRLPHLAVRHETISSRAARVPSNPLFPVNLLDLLIRHGGANHKRETIAFSKRRASAIERLAVFLVWRNWIKAFSERERGASPAMRLGLAEARLTVEQVLARRLFPGRIRLPSRWQPYYWRTVRTRILPRCVVHRRRYAM
jgi:transposase-like protein